MDVQSKYRAAMAAIKESANTLEMVRGVGRPMECVGRVAEAIGLHPKVVRRNRLHCSMRQEAWIASYKLAGREDDGA